MTGAALPDESRVAALVAAHAPRFSASVLRVGGVPAVELRHPASGGVIFAFQPPRQFSEGEFAQRLQACDELGLIARAPADLPHPALCLRVRTAAEVLRWDAGTVREVTQMLEEAGGLTGAEAGWLRSLPAEPSR